MNDDQTGELLRRLDDLFNDAAEHPDTLRGLTPDQARAVACGVMLARRLTIGEIRRYHADQAHPPGPCQRPGCGHPADWHVIADSPDTGPADPGALYRCLGHDPISAWRDQDAQPVRVCDCPDLVRAPDPRPARWYGRWPSACDLCGHVHTPGERCADHVWRDDCPYQAGRYCGREHLDPATHPATPGGGP